MNQLKPRRAAVAKTARDPREIRLLLSSDLISVRHALIELQAALRQREVPADMLIEIELVLAEVLNNICKHAYDNDPAGLVRLVVRIREGAVHCSTVDRGRPLPGQAPPPARRLSSPDAHGTPESGFGWHIIQELTSTLRYARRRGRNHMCFTIRSSALQAVA